MALMRNTGGSKAQTQGFDLLYQNPDKPKYMGSFQPLAEQQAYYTGGAIDELQRATGQGQATLQDFYQQAMGQLEAGQGGAMDYYQQAADVYNPYIEGAQAADARLQGGFGAYIDRARMDSAPLVEERTSDISDYLKSVGSSRSGHAAEEIGRVSEQTNIDLAMQQLAQDQMLSQQGMTGAAGRGGALSQLGAAQYGYGQDLANLTTGTGGQLAGLQLGLGTDIAGLYGTMGQNLMDLYTARMQKNAAEKAAQRQMTGDIIGGLASAGGQLGGAAILASDKRLKKNIKPLFTKGGINFYSFDANEEGERVGMTMKEGVIAQEVEKVYPDLVHEINGYKAVDYTGLLERVA